MNEEQLAGYQRAYNEIIGYLSSQLSRTDKSLSSARRSVMSDLVYLMKFRSRTDDGGLDLSTPTSERIEK